MFTVPVYLSAIIHAYASGNAKDPYLAQGRASRQAHQSMRVQLLDVQQGGFLLDPTALPLSLYFPILSAPYRKNGELRSLVRCDDLFRYRLPHVVRPAFESPTPGVCTDEEHTGVTLRCPQGLTLELKSPVREPIPVVGPKKKFLLNQDNKKVKKTVALHDRLNQTAAEAADRIAEAEVAAYDPRVVNVDTYDEDLDASTLR